MNMRLRFVSIVGAVAVALAFATAGAQSKKDVSFVDSKKAEFKQVVPGVKKAVLWGDHDAGPYGAFTKFDPGLVNPLHTHTSEVRIVVLRGAYIYKSKDGKERRVGPGAYISVPAGDVHVSSADKKEGALYYEESPGKFDLVPVDKK
jgi:quercetin dioxygenase-like cupin family protein